MKKLQRLNYSTAATFCGIIKEVLLGQLLPPKWLILLKINYGLFLMLPHHDGIFGQFSR